MQKDMRKVFIVIMLLGFCLPVVAQNSNTEFKIKDRFMPTGKRIDRNIHKNVFAYKGEWALGLTASYGTLSSDNSDIFAVLENINASGSVTSISPFISYFVANNTSVGLRLGYSQINGNMDDMDLNLGSSNDVGITIPLIDLASKSYKASLFMRNYAPIDAAGRFGVFSELEASYSYADNQFAYRSNADDPLNCTNSESTTVKLWFNPGLAVYMFPNVCATISFGMGGFKYTSIKQFDDQGNSTGTRTSSKLRFRLNVADIHFGLNIHLWGKNKMAR